MPYRIKESGHIVRICIPPKRKWYSFPSAIFVMIVIMISFVIVFYASIRDMFRADELGECFFSFFWGSFFIILYVNKWNDYCYVLRGCEVLDIDLKKFRVDFYRKGLWKFDRLAAWGNLWKQKVLKSEEPRWSAPVALFFGFSGGKLKVMGNYGDWYDFGVTLSEREADELFEFIQNLPLPQEDEELEGGDSDNQINENDFLLKPDFSFLDLIALFFYRFFSPILGKNPLDRGRLILWSAFLSLKFIAIVYLLQYFFFPGACSDAGKPCFICVLSAITSFLSFYFFLYLHYLKNEWFELLIRKFHAERDRKVVKKVYLFGGLYFMLSLIFLFFVKWLIG